ncbi:PH domain-containing protein [Paludisphaera sp.]|uniref:PH domain-containing protein n=1 Tax=Paludisphaera sp. TaxID=2017432 RepID=UPI00301D4BD1
MTAETDDTPLLVARATPVPRQFRLVGGIHSIAIALFVGALALIALKFAADAARGVASDGNLRFALAWSAVATATAFFALLALHHRALIGARSRTAYLVFADRVEIRRDGSPRPLAVIPLARAIAVESWTGPLLRPGGLATLTIVEEGPPDPAGRRRHVFHPLPNVAEPEAVAEAIRSRLGGRPRPSG